MEKIYKWIALTLLCFSVIFNLWLYQKEKTALIDPNDNAFQYGLIDRTNTIWDYASKKCPKNITFLYCHFSYLSDHWVPNWAQGYNLPYYYSHIPQIVIVGSYRLFHIPLSLFQYYHVVIYLFLCLLPVSLFLSCRILRLSWITAGIAALFTLLISTDGLYGIDPSSFLWRGWGLSSQLFALLWFPITVASAIRYETTKNTSSLWMAICFLVLTTMGHLGIGMMAFMAIGVVSFFPIVQKIATQEEKKNIYTAFFHSIKHTLIITLPALFVLSYWIVPAFIHNEYHNISIWDPLWKFNSFGAKEVITKLVSGELFDFGRFPLFTFLVFVGLLSLRLPQCSLLFLFFLVLFFGKTTFGNIFDLIPGMSEFHGHRFIVGVHLAGLFLAPIGLTWCLDHIISFFKRFARFNIYLHSGIVFVIIVASFLILAPQPIRYATHNDVLIVEANKQYLLLKPDTDLLFSTLKTLQQDHPGRVYALRANEGKNFRIASSPYYMQLSTFGVPTVLWLPETWSLNADTEQFFSEDNEHHYCLYNIAYVVAPPEKTPQPFWTLAKETPSWKLYTVQTDGYISVGTAPSTVASKKTDLVNLVHLFVQSTYPDQSLFPELVVAKNLRKQPSPSPLPSFSMVDAVSYKTPDGKTHSLFAEPPIYQSPLNNPLPIRVLSEDQDTDMTFTTTVEVQSSCPTCIVVLKQTFHPNWHATIQGKPIQTLSVFPFFTAIRLEKPGIYTIVFSYTPKLQK